MCESAQLRTAVPSSVDGQRRLSFRNCFTSAHRSFRRGPENAWSPVVLGGNSREHSGLALCFSPRGRRRYNVHENPSSCSATRFTGSRSGPDRSRSIARGVRVRGRGCSPSVLAKRLFCYRHLAGNFRLWWWKRIDRCRPTWWSARASAGTHAASAAAQQSTSTKSADPCAAGTGTAGAQRCAAGSSRAIAAARRAEGIVAVLGSSAGRGDSDDAGQWLADQHLQEHGRSVLQRLDLDIHGQRLQR